MANACLFIGWNRPNVGMNKEAWGFLMNQGMEMLNNWQKKGWFETHDQFGLTAHGGDLNGMIILQGERAKLDELRRTDEFERFSMRMSELFGNYGVVPGVNGKGIQEVAARNKEMLS